jgi:membrane peptidoglycan carboxypeptidase
MGVASELNPVFSLALGTGEVSPLDMAAAYSTLANYGLQNDPYLIERIEDEDGTVLYQATPEPEQVLDETLAAVVVDVMKKVVARGTGTAANIDRPQAGKTGTNQRFRDAWFVGYVPQFSTAVWVGHADAQISMVNITINGIQKSRWFGGDVAAPIWAEFMEEFLADVPVEDFPPIPDGASKFRVTPQTTVPDIMTMEKKEATQEILFAHLTPEFVDVDSLEPEGTILSQLPEAGGIMNHAGVVVIEISTGLPPTVPLPNLLMLTRTEANLVMAGLAAETGVLVALVPEFQVSDPASWNKIFLTRPTPGALVGSDDIITIFIGKPPDS